MQFDTYIGIDYSGAEKAQTPLNSLCVYVAERDKPAEEEHTISDLKSNWTRSDVADWLVTKLSQGGRTLVGIDHGFSFPKAYFERHRLAAHWPEFLKFFQQRWPTDEPGVTVNDLRKSGGRNHAYRRSDRDLLRLTERWTVGAKSVFRFGVPGQVATSTHAGLPWLLYIRRHLGSRVHFWPFDGWQFGDDESVVVEVYPSLWKKRFPSEVRGPDQQDAYSIAAWMQRANRDGCLAHYFRPCLNRRERAIARQEGWILGVL
jgi:hypothetical protein